MRNNHPVRVLAVLSAMMLILGLITVPASADAATGSMTGPVYGLLNPDTGTYPRLAGVVVTVVPADNENVPVATATTGPTGWYTIDGLAPGTYKVHFAGDPDLYKPQWFSGADSFAEATAVTIYAGVRRDGVGTYLGDATTSIAGSVSGPYDAQAGTYPTRRRRDREPAPGDRRERDSGEGGDDGRRRVLLHVCRPSRPVQGARRPRRPRPGGTTLVGRHDLRRGGERHDQSGDALRLGLRLLSAHHRLPLGQGRRALQFGDGRLRWDGGPLPGGRRERPPGGERDHRRGRDLRDPGHSAG